jgi:hypothetical protein
MPVTTTSLIARFLLPLACFPIVACDAQSPTDYNGEPLFATLGRVELEPGTDTEALVPAIAFSVPSKSALEIMDADVQGEFPNRFQLALYTPPPDDTLVSYSAPNGATRLSLGYVTAVHADHPQSAPIVRTKSDTRSIGTCPADGCIEQGSWCIGEGQDEQCYSETYRCDDANEELDQCAVVDHQGDASIREEPWSTLAGLSQNFVVLYLKDALLPNTQAGLAFGFKQPAVAGYHLIGVRDSTADEAQAAKACASNAEDVATDRYNSIHGTMLTFDEIETHNCVDDGCDSVDLAELDGLVTQVRLEMSCPDIEHVMTPVDDPAAHPIVVQLGKNIRSMLPL